MVGKKAPEMAVGRLFDVLRGAWYTLEHDILSDDHGVLNQEDLELLTNEVARAKEFIAATLHLKLDYWNTLLWLLCGLALEDEDKARDVARSCLDKFNENPGPPPLQHRLTWRLLQPGSWFRKAHAIH